MKFAPLLHVIALLIALFVQTMNTPLAGAWLFFHFMGCAVIYNSSNKRNLYWWLILSWLVVLGLNTFILSPVTNGAATMWILSAMPMLALCLNKKHLNGYLGCFLVVLLIYSLGLIGQMLLCVRYTAVDYYQAWRGSQAVAWPLLDPNNAALVVNCGLIPCFYLGLRKPRWLVLTGYFAFALFATASKGGFIAAAVACLFLVYERFGNLAFVIMGFPSLIALDLLLPRLQVAFSQRIPIWSASVPLLWKAPLTGLGLGTFGSYYQKVRTEDYTGGWFAHNDILQLAIETGIPAALLFCVIFAMVALKTNRNNLVSACVLFAVLFQASIEFQFYLPSVSILAGLALAHHRLMEA